MVQLDLPPSYRYEPIRSIPALSRALGYPVAALNRLALRADSLYRLAKPIAKADGSIRQPFDALEPLKSVHRSLKLRILRRVVFPDYLTGSVQGKDARRNADLHAGAAIVVCEDIASFFPSTTEDVVYDIWSGFFGFGPEVAQLLTALTVKDGVLPQGSIPASYLANLAFWRTEHGLYERLASKGIRYSRFVDDVTISCAKPLDRVEVSAAISGIYGLMANRGYTPKRSKQEITRGNQAMRVTKLVVNRRAALAPRERSAIRAGVKHLEVKLVEGDLTVEELHAAANSMAGRVGRLLQLHRSEGAALMARVAAVRAECAMRKARMEKAS